MKNIILTIGMFLFLISAYSQEADSTIVFKKNKFYQNEQQISKTDLSKLLANNPASSMEYQKHVKNSHIGMGFALGGVILLTTAAAIDLSATIKETKDLNNGVYTGDYAGANAGLYVGAVVFTLVGAGIVFWSNKKHMHKSIELYNSSFTEAMKRPIKYEMIVNSNGLGVRMTF